MDLTDDGYVFTKRELAVLLDVAHDKKAPLDERAIRFHGRNVYATDRTCLLRYSARAETPRAETFAVDANDVRSILKEMKVKDTALVRCTSTHVEVEAPAGSVAVKMRHVDLDALQISESMLATVAKDRTPAERTDCFVIASRMIHLVSKLMTALGDPECWTMTTGASESCPVRVLAGSTLSPSDVLLVAMPLVPCVDKVPEGAGA